MKPDAPVLVVEDDLAVRETLRDVLEMEGYRVLTAENGAEALAVLSRSTPPCLILLDLMMPVMDGWQLLEILRSPGDGTPYATIPVAVISAVAELNDLQTRYSCQVISKPASLEEIVGVAHACCRDMA